MGKREVENGIRTLAKLSYGITLFRTLVLIVPEITKPYKSSSLQLHELSRPECGVASGRHFDEDAYNRQKQLDFRRCNSSLGAAPHCLLHSPYAHSSPLRRHDRLD